MSACRCFVGKRNLEAAIATQQLKDRTEVHWKPFFLDVNRKESDEPIMVHINRKYGKAAGERMSAALKSAGLGQGINFTDDRKVL
jgi:predicted DsbA family dithiol-disulfide isomerase